MYIKIVIRCEKKDKQSAAAIFFVQQQKSDTSTLLDGIGISENNNTNIVIESSGYNISTDLDHALEDSMKNIKSGTDALKGIMCKYPNASKNTMERVHVYSVHVIQTSMTLVRYSLKNPKSWKAVECGSAKLPLFFKERKQLIQVYDIFALLYVDLQDQQAIFQKLEDEQLGLLKVNEEDMICSCST